jgi:aminopeptidase N
MNKFLSYVHSYYEMPRVLSTPSLLQANESFLYYRKGGLAMYALSKYIGKEKVNAALRNMLQKRESGELPLPTTLNLFNELQTVTPDSLHYLLSDLFKQNTYWRLKTKSIAATKSNDGNWNVTLKVEAQKSVMDLSGKETDFPMNDWLEIGLYEEVKGHSRPMYLKMHRIRTGEQTIAITVPRRPDSGGIDPNNLMIDLRLEDNIMQMGNN